jgi:rSAM/selenodomain-associated transferase 1
LALMFLFRKEYEFDFNAMQQVALLVIAKQPVAGRVKTRLTPPCSPAQAATLAGAALKDTIHAVANTPARDRLLVFDGDPTGWQADGFDVVAQRGDGLGERLQAAFDGIDGPGLLVGMDTPQLTPSALQEAALALMAPDVDAVLGPTIDGGYWCIGFKRPVAGAFEGVPMSSSDTYLRQRQRLSELGLNLRRLQRLRDVDTIADARLVAGSAPDTRFARTLATIL